MTDTIELLETIAMFRSKQAMMFELYEGQIAGLMVDLEKALKAEGKDCMETDHAVAFYRNNTQAKVEDWGAVMKYVKENDAFDILQRRIAPAALEHRIKAGAKIAGVTIEKGKTLIVKERKINAKDKG